MYLLSNNQVIKCNDLVITEYLQVITQFLITYLSGKYQQVTWYLLDIFLTSTRYLPNNYLVDISWAGTDKALLPSKSIIRVIRVNICARIEWKSSLGSWLCQRSVIGYSAPPLHNADVLLCPALITHTQNSSLSLPQSLRFAGHFPLMFRVSSASGLLLLRLVLTYEPVEFW